MSTTAAADLASARAEFAAATAAAEAAESRAAAAGERLAAVAVERPDVGARAVATHAGLMEVAARFAAVADAYVETAETLATP